MKTKFSETNQSAFFNLRVLVGLFIVLAGLFLAFAGFGAFSNVFAQAQKNDRSATQDAPGTQTPDVVRLIGPVVQNTDLRDLPYIPPAPQILKQRLTAHSRPQLEEPAQSESSAFPQFQSLLEK